MDHGVAVTEEPACAVVIAATVSPTGKAMTTVAAGDGAKVPAVLCAAFGKPLARDGGGPDRLRRRKCAKRMQILGR